ncbi:putative DNA-binding transcriptional regulator YafY [Nocardioides soli]|uniref:Putative DNA-binding transcriptional regulator YafY n=1 Tax=Nocardioides soli TaxID=1036020 RepID=A0A7W4VTQ4_9ACTN|nr:putative DNA-binding transcriptional regulator YafY [Nocardioides soli]
MDVVVNEARLNRTVLLTARESDGSTETREVEPYSIRPGAAGKPDRLFAYCLQRASIRSWHLVNLISAEATGNPFEPRWAVEL